MTGDLPKFARSNFAGTTYGLAGQGGGLNQLYTTTSTAATPFIGALFNDPKDEERALRHMKAQALQYQNQQPKTKKEEKAVADKPTRRLVQVVIADANENVPLESCLLYEGKPKLTDLTDQELFFELDVKEMLATHNAKRVKFIDKKVKERTEHLEPAKVRDLKMVVVTIAEF